MITAGPTYEKIDPVRFIGNYSSGKMGYALAEECAKRGADVTLVSGPTSLECPKNVKRINVESCKEMYDSATDEFKHCDAAILCAAVADFKPAQTANKKIKRGNDDLVINFIPTQDIAAELGRTKHAGQILVGFALETDNEDTNAKKKLDKKNLDFIVLNSTRNKGTTFRSDDNQIKIITSTEVKEYDKKDKHEVARDIIDELVATIKQKNL